MTYAQIAPPVAEPLTLAEVKAHLRLDTDDEDTLLQSLVSVARQHLERATGLALMAQSWRLYLDAWPDGPIQIDRGPVQAIESVTVYDAAGEPVAVPLEGHMLDGTGFPARLFLPHRMNSERPLNGIEIDFTAGFGAAVDVPGGLKRAMLTHIAQMFSFRGVVAAADQPVAVPDGYDRLIAPYLPWRL